VQCKLRQDSRPCCRLKKVDTDIKVKLRRRCENVADSERAIHARVSIGSGQDGDGRRFISAGDFGTSVVTEIDIRKLDKGFKNGEPW